MKAGEDQPNAINQGHGVKKRSVRSAIRDLRSVWWGLVVCSALSACGMEATPMPTPVATSAVQQATPISAPLIMPTASSDALAARVNGHAITLAQFNQQASAAEVFLRAQGVDLNSPEGRERLKLARRETLDDLIEQALIEQAAQELNLRVSETQLDAELQKAINELGGQAAFAQALAQQNQTREEFRASLRANLLAAQLRDKVTAAPPTRGEQVHVRHILVQTQTQAQQIRARLMNGGDFGALAQQYSVDVTTKDSGGDLGWTPRGLLPATIEKAAFALNKNQVSDVVSSPLGFHILQLLEREVNRPIAPEMQTVLRENALVNWLETQKNKAQIERYIE